MQKRSKIIVIASMLALIVGESVTATGCTTTDFLTPSALIIEKPPVLMTVYQLEAAYAQDAETANNQYAGRRLYFKQVTVDISNIIGNAARSTENSIVVNKIKFVPRYPSDMEGITQGAVVDVIGRVQGYLWGYVIITDCWIKLTTIGGPPPPMY